MIEWSQAARATVLISLVSCAAMGCGACGAASSSQQGDSTLRLVVFLEGTPEARTNDLILEKYMLPLYQKLAQSEKPFSVVVLPISGNTEGEVPLLRYERQGEFPTEGERAELANQFAELKKAYNRVYPPRASYLVDVLGTAILLDSYLGANQGRVEVLYLSDMIQQEDVNGYDFTEYARGKDLETCKAELSERFGPHIQNPGLFAKARVHLVYPGLDALRRGGEGEGDLAVSGPVARNLDEIRTFWKKDFFQGFLKVESVQDYPGGIEDAFRNIGL